MFRRLPTFQQPDARLKQLAEQMHEAGDGGEDNTEIAAGYTYLGQFIDHDITFDPVSSLERANDPDALVNFRTPRFDLDSLYGSGPADEPFLYQRETPPRLLVGKGRDVDSGEETEEDDLPRNSEGTALIGDPRNDENVIVSGLQLILIQFHNKVVELITSQAPNLKGEELLKEVQRVVRWHYQWVVIHDFLVQIVGQEVVDSILLPIDPEHPELGQRVKTRFYRPKQQAYMPVEFSVAAYRFGHSMVRPTYKINNPVPELPIFAETENPGPLEDFHGGRHLPRDWTIDWSFFFDTAGPGTAKQRSRLINTQIASGLFKLPGADGEMESLALRNLRRGKTLGLPSGRRVATAMGVEPLTPDELGFSGPAPLWFYVLKEAEVRQGGQRLSPVGATIVAEVLLGLLAADPLSYLSVEPAFRPLLSDPDGDGRFTIADLINFARGTAPTPPPPPGGWGS
jgi:Animal haem peroxidase